jgi:hypothetical protein
MALIIMLAIIAVAIYAILHSQPGFVRGLIIVGILLAIGAWLPLLAAIVIDPDGRVVGNGLGLGLLAWLGSALGFLVIIVGLLVRLTQMLSAR